MIRTFFRECGRKDPLWEEDVYASGVDRKNQWGLNTALQELSDTSVREHNERDVAWQNTRREATQSGAPHNEARPVYRLPEGLPEVADYTHEHVMHIRIVGKTLMLFDGENSVELARFIGHRKDLYTVRRSRRTRELSCAVLLNGDGFDNRTHQTIQAIVRERVHLMREFGILRTMIVPHMALRAAQINIDTMRCVEVTRDGTEAIDVPIHPPTQGDALLTRNRYYEDHIHPLLDRIRENNERYGYPDGRWKDFEYMGRKWRYMATGSVCALESDEESFRGLTDNWQIWHQPENGVMTWCPVVLNESSKTGWVIRTNVHRLGSCVFTAEGPDGQRHRYLSSFDMNEPQPLYFLAQLPDQGKATTYREALDVLAPPIVHEARRDGRIVYRQGDVFFVETKLTDAELKKQRAKIAEGVTKRRQYVTNANGKRTRPVVEMPVTERNIYGTGHIATNVARMRNGVTLAKGTAEHYPAFTEPGRQPEHRPILLEPVQSWFLCCRNTVPRAVSQDSSLPAADAVAAVATAVTTNTQKRKVKTRAKHTPARAGQVQ